MDADGVTRAKFSHSVTLSEAAKEDVYLADFLGELGYSAQSTVKLATDNRQSCYSKEN